MSKRNGTVTDAYDHEHRRRFVTKARGVLQMSRQQARSVWARRIRGEDTRGNLLIGHIFDDVSREMSQEVAP